MSALTPVERFRWMARLRAFDEACLEGVPTREIHGELHTGIGQEAIAAGMAGWLRGDDAVVSTHRNHFHALVKGVDPRALMAEIFERRTGLCGGFGGHMHPFDAARRFSASGIVGASLPVALGHAYAAVMEGRDSIAVAVSGDGGANHGTFHETLNMAAAWDLPLLVLIENNSLAISVPSEEVVATSTLAERAAAYECVGITVDGTDAEAVDAAFGELVPAMRADPGPCVIEASCARFQGHFEGDPQLYRRPEEQLELRDARDPLRIARSRLVASGAAASEQLDAIEAEAIEEMRALLATVRADPRPDPGRALDHVFAEEAA